MYTPIKGQLSIEMNHRYVCLSEETLNHNFTDKVKERAYHIYIQTNNPNSEENYYEALNQIRKENCKCGKRDEIK